MRLDLDAGARDAASGRVDHSARQGRRGVDPRELDQQRRCEVVHGHVAAGRVTAAGFDPDRGVGMHAFEHETALAIAAGKRGLVVTLGAVPAALDPSDRAGALFVDDAPGEPASADDLDRLEPHLLGAGAAIFSDVVGSGQHQRKGQGAGKGVGIIHVGLQAAPEGAVGGRRRGAIESGHGELHAADFRAAVLLLDHADQADRRSELDRRLGPLVGLDDEIQRRKYSDCQIRPTLPIDVERHQSGDNRPEVEMAIAVADRAGAAASSRIGIAAGFADGHDPQARKFDVGSQPAGQRANRRQPRGGDGRSGTFLNADSLLAESRRLDRDFVDDVKANARQRCPAARIAVDGKAAGELSWQLLAGNDCRCHGGLAQRVALGRGDFDNGRARTGRVDCQRPVERHRQPRQPPDGPQLVIRDDPQHQRIGEAAGGEVGRQGNLEATGRVGLPGDCHRWLVAAQGRFGIVRPEPQHATQALEIGLAGDDDLRPGDRAPGGIDERTRRLARRHIGRGGASQQHHEREVHHLGSLRRNACSDGSESPLILT